MGYGTSKQIEGYLDNTRVRLNSQLPKLCRNSDHNLTSKQSATIKNFKQSTSTLTMKPVDKNLGIALLDTTDYNDKCLELLRNTDTYRLCHDFPDKTECLLIDLLVSHRQRKSIRKRLYYFLQPRTKHQIPQFHLSIEGVHARKE